MAGWSDILLGPQGGTEPTLVDQPTPSGQWSDQLLGPSQPAIQQPTQQKPVNPYAEPDAKTWVGRRVQDFMGKRDSRYDGIPAIAEVLLNEGGHKVAPEAWAWLTGAQDKDMTGVYKSMLGDRFVRSENDANGNPVIVYRGKSGGEQKAYVNVPGLDVQDVVRGVYGALPFVATGGMAGAALKSAPAIVGVAGQAGTAAVTSVGQDLAGAATGVSKIDTERSAEKAGYAALGGAVGEIGGRVLGAYSRYKGARKYYDPKTGQLTETGKQALIENGIDPDNLPKQVAQDFAKQMARTGDPAAALRQSVSNEFRISRTRGELTGDKNQLLREQQMRGGTYGETASAQMQAFDRGQALDIENAIRGVADSPGIAGTIAPNRAGRMGGVQINKKDLGQNIRDNTQTAKTVAESAATDAWEAVPRINATDEFRSVVESSMPRLLRGLQVEESVTPVAANMAKALDEFVAGVAPRKVANILPDSSVGDVNAFRKRLLKMMGSAATREDKMAASKIYDAFNRSIYLAAERTGDAAAAAQLRIARGLTRELKTIFEGPSKTPGARILKDVLEKSDSAEGVINALFTGPTAQIKNGSKTALESIKRAYDRYLPADEAAAAWNDIRLAYFMKAVEMKSGEVMTPGALSTALKNMQGTQKTIADILYTPKEQAMMRRLASVLDDVKKKNPNSSWSGISIGALVKDMGDSILSMIGANTVIARTAARAAMGPVRGVYGSVQAGHATGSLRGASAPNAPSPVLGQYGAALGAQYGGSRNNRLLEIDVATGKVR